MLNGRYGADKLGFIMVSSSIILTVIAALLNAENFVMKLILLFLSAVILLYAVYRVFSFNITARQRELSVIDMLQLRLVAMFGNHETQIVERHINEPEQNYNEEPEIQEEIIRQETDEFKHFKCPRCKKSLKVPVGKGYVKVICPACSHKFMKHT